MTWVCRHACASCVREKFQVNLKLLWLLLLVYVQLVCSDIDCQLMCQRRVSVDCVHSACHWCVNAVCQCRLSVICQWCVSGVSVQTVSDVSVQTVSDVSALSVLFCHLTRSALAWQLLSTSANTMQCHFSPLSWHWLTASHFLAFDNIAASHLSSHHHNIATAHLLVMLTPFLTCHYQKGLHIISKSVAHPHKFCRWSLYPIFWCWCTVASYPPLTNPANPSFSNDHTVFTC